MTEMESVNPNASKDYEQQRSLVLSRRNALGIGLIEHLLGRKTGNQDSTQRKQASSLAQVEKENR